MPAATRVEPARARASYAIDPAELGDDGVIAKIPHHARILRFRRARVSLDGEPFERGASAADSHPVFPVIGETRDRVRVVSDDDDAIVALWIERADLATTLVAPVQLMDEVGSVPVDAGVWLDAGADVDVGSPHDGRREIALVDDAVKAKGWVRDDAIGTVWVDQPVARTAAKTHVLEAHATIRAAARADAPAIAETIEELRVSVIAGRGTWTQIELARPGARIRGFVLANQVDTTEGMIGHGSGTGHGFGISDTDEFEVTKGACLFDRDAGDVIGVTTGTKVRYGSHRRDHLEWAKIYVDTSWGLASVTVHDTARSADPAKARWESCDKP